MAEDCEFPEIRCLGENDTIYYQFLHFRVRTPERREISAKEEQPMNVAVLFLDAVSLSAARRALNGTFKLLEQSYGAYIFEGYNVVGENSLPNGAAVLTGTVTVQ